MTAETKLTKSMKYGMIREILVNANADPELIDLCDAEIAAIANKAVKAKARAAEKAAEGDELRAAVEAVLTSDPQTAEDILNQIEGEDLTKAKIVARLTQLIKAGKASKAPLTVNGRKVMAYTTFVAPTEE